MKILSVPEIKQADAYAIDNESVSSIDLMERAANACFQWIKQRFDRTIPFKIVCGTGNNGGDGLAIARMLKGSGFHVDVFVIHYSDYQSPDFQINAQRWKENKSNCIIDISNKKDIPSIEKDCVVIDAIFGTGLSKPADDLVASCIRKINSSNATIVAVDIPSGLFADVPVDHKSEIIKANFTLSFQVPKLAFMFSENYPYVGEWIVVNIGLNENFINQLHSNRFILDKQLAKSILKPRQKFAHKGHFGHVFLIAGSYGKIGAAILASKACLRAGAGLLTVHVPGCGCQVLQASVPEAMVQTDADEHCFTSAIATDQFQALGIGCGIGTDEKTMEAMKQLLTAISLPVVIDADAINILGINKNLLHLLPVNAIITPHPKEFERITMKAKNDFHRLELQIEFAKKYKVIVVLKGAHTSIACADGTVYFNNTGNPGMAKGGTGDALTGVILALLAQQYTPKEACLLGVYLHGLAGDMAAKKTSMHSMIASDLIESLGQAYNEISDRAFSI